MSTCKKQAFINKLKKNISCRRCKYNICSDAIDFHHISNGDKIDRIIRCGSKRNMVEELLKCIPLCSNCHREYHANLFDDLQYNPITLEELVKAKMIVITDIEGPSWVVAGGGNQWSQDEIDYLRENFHDYTAKELANFLKRTVASVNLKANKLGLTKSRVSN